MWTASVTLLMFEGNETVSCALFGRAVLVLVWFGPRLRAGPTHAETRRRRDKQDPVYLTSASLRAIGFFVAFPAVRVRESGVEPTTHFTTGLFHSWAFPRPGCTSQVDATLYFTSDPFDEVSLLSEGRFSGQIARVKSHSYK